MHHEYRFANALCRRTINVSDSASKILAILRIWNRYETQDLMGQFKFNIWGLVEGHDGRYFHTPSFMLENRTCSEQLPKEIRGLSPEQLLLILISLLSDYSVLLQSLIWYIDVL